MIHALKTISCVAPMLAATVVGVGAIAPAAQASSLVPQAEGEVNVGLGACLGDGCSYLTLDSVIESIDSLVDSSTGTQSRLFVDKAGTNNSYFGGLINFRSKDIGTSEGSGDYWFRPVAMTESGTGLLEDGQLEVGTFKFNFNQILTDLTVNWFDTERKNGTDYIVEYGDGTTSSGIIAAGPNNNIQSSTFTNVRAITLNLGERHGRTGDGVNFQANATVPEPGLMLGLGAFAVAGGLGLRKRQTDDTAA